jgi:hypothetical protein
LSPGGALQAKIPLAATIAKIEKGIETRNRLLWGLVVEPPGSDKQDKHHATGPQLQILRAALNLHRVE